MTRRTFLRALLVAAALAATTSVPARLLADVTIRPGTKVVFVGDSITAQGWYNCAGCLADQINGQFQTITAPRSASVSESALRATAGAGARVASVAPLSSAQSPIVQVHSGVSGNETADIDAAVASRITNHNPDVIVMLVGVNDVNLSESTAFIQTHYGSILSQVRAWSATVPIVCISILYIGEQWGAGPVWANAKDTALNAANVAEQTLAATYGATWVDVRASALTYETTHNAPAPGAASGILSADGIHPNATGQMHISNTVLPVFTVIP